MILFSLRDWDSAVDAYYYVLSKCPAALERRIAAAEEEEKQKAPEAKCAYTPTTKNKDASVVGRAVVGGGVAGPVGAVVGALSAVDKNNRKRCNIMGRAQVRSIFLTRTERTSHEKAHRFVRFSVDSACILPRLMIH